MSIAWTTERLVEELRKAGLRVTPQRLAILHALLTSKQHPTAHVLFEQLQPAAPSLSRATVYNTLQTLVDHGLLQEIGEAGDRAVHYDADPTPHINFVCKACHRVQDFSEIALDGTAREVIERSGYRVAGMRIVYYGLCPECQLRQIEGGGSG